MNNPADQPPPPPRTRLRNVLRGMKEYAKLIIPLVQMPFKFGERKINESTEQKLRYVFGQQASKKFFDVQELFLLVLLSILSLIGIGLMIASLQVIWDEKTREIHDTLDAEIIRAVISGTTMVALGVNLNYWRVKTNQKALNYRIVGGLWLWEEPTNLRKFFATSCVLAIHPPPGLSYLMGENHWFIQLLSLGMFFRLYYPLLLIFLFTNFWRTKDILNKFAKGRAEVTYGIAAKTIFRMHPVIVTTVISGPIFFALTYCCYVSERTTQPYAFGNFNNVLWYSVVTISTTGYGDFSPQSDFGRFFGTMSIIWGVIFTSIITAALIDQIILSREERNVVNYFVFRNESSRLKQTSATLIQAAYRKHLWLKHHYDLTEPRQRWRRELFWNKKISKLVIQQRKQQQKAYAAALLLRPDQIRDKVEVEIDPYDGFYMTKRMF